ncbi:hypothetical protein AJ80_04797 [Polytolypa hystricis UAMH7299]|uniref:F-box domain-containing protein n=1 Tax=Polytolypa hystricis (strain UAMH7299) TaxID=1447883 RepID=A0A2B7YA07_POLH7|nr:hypothetical protein AJ80_04797 [Polytolypa hystricis UAMH7299]
MQSEPTLASHNASSEHSPPTSPSSSTQHGQDAYHHQPAHVHLPSEDGGLQLRAALHGDASAGAATHDQLSDPSSQRRVSPDRCGKSDSSADRIRLYENATSPAPRKAEDFGFKVVPSRIDASAAQSIEAFPNEVLTHILSHLPPTSLSSMSLVSRRFHGLVTTPHAWRIAFSRYFQGPASLNADGDTEEYEYLLSLRRAFARLTALASWRSEYILRTRLLRSLSRGKPAEHLLSNQLGAVRQISTHTASAVFTYTSHCLYPVTHIDGLFGPTSSKKPPVFIHGASEQGVASVSDPTSGRGALGITDAQMFRHFTDLFPGEEEWGLGAGNLVGMPNVMDVSQPYGMVYGEGCPQGRTYFLSSNEKRGRFLTMVETPPNPLKGIPSLNMITTSICSVWIARSPQILKLTNGLFGILSGSSSGVLTAYALGPNPSYDKRFERGEVTAKWVLSPGVPIIGIRVDENYSRKRCGQRRIWAVVLNALGEVFYLTHVPVQPEGKTKPSVEEIDQLAWATGRAVRWELIEPTRRTARPDPFNSLLVDGSYSPRSSSHSMRLSPEQVAAETREIEKFLAFKPKHFRKVCHGWNMRQRLEVDFSGGDTHGGKESIVVIDCGFEEGQSASIRRFTRHESHVSAPDQSNEAFPKIQKPQPSIFGVGVVSSSQSVPLISENVPLSPASSNLSEVASTSTSLEWRISDFIFHDQKLGHITTSAIDISTYAQMTISEDPLLGMCGDSAASSQISTPTSHTTPLSSPAQIPGQRARYMAVGTSNGVVFVWDIRAATSQTAGISNKVAPIYIIPTDSPQISCLALTSLYLVHGGNDGLVQAWDPLASTTQPVRTLNSRFSNRARRRLVQAEATAQGVGHNFFAAGAICLDPDPTVLRGVVSLGSQLRYWAYSSSAADQYKSHKRKLRYSPRGSNSSLEGQRFSTTGRGALKDYIASEKFELERQKRADEKERELLSGRFGTDLLGPGASEEDMLAYAVMLSEEAYTSDERKRRDSGASGSSSSSNMTVTPNGEPVMPAGRMFPSIDTVEEEDDVSDPEIAEAIRLSLLERNDSQAASASVQSDSGAELSTVAAESSSRQEVDDLEFALQLSLAEERSKEDTRRHSTSESPPPSEVVEVEDGFPPLAGASAEYKGKEKSRAEP